MRMLDGERTLARPASRWPPKPHHQIAVLTLVALLAVTTAAIVAKVRLAQIDHTNTLVERHSEITDALTQAELLFQSDITEVNQVLLTNSAADRSASISGLSEKARAADAAWATYKRKATGVPGEAGLREAMERAEAEQIALVAPVLTGHTPEVGVAENAARVGATQIDAIEALRSRYATKELRELAMTSATIDLSRRDLLITIVAEFAFLLLVFGAAFASVRRRDRQFVASETQRSLEAARNDLETRVARSLEMVHTEEAAYVRVERAIAEVAPDQRAQVLVADSSRAHLHQAFALNFPSENSGCAVGTPGDCPAMTRGQTQLFANSGALDACPYLGDRPDGACSAACVPMSIGGKSIGVIHVIDAPKQSLDPEIATRLELISRKAGDRIGMLRAFTRSETEARTDQLTGLLNRRSLEDEVRRLTDASRPYTVAFGDLDHFKELNDVYGHDAGDRALRLFSRVLRDSVRPRDIPARYGGEEFVVILPDCTVSDATQVLERVQENLVRAQSAASGPPFTVSFGLSDSNFSADFVKMLKSADQALGEAKVQGRDRIATSSASVTSSKK